MFRLFRVSFVVTAALLATSFATAPIQTVRAQDVLKYGDLVSGTTTEDEAEVSYEFEGRNGDLVIALANRAPRSELAPEIDITNEDGDVISTSINSFSSISALIAFELPADGTYTLRVFGTTGLANAKDTFGDFTLQLINPPFISAGQEVDVRATSDQTLYYELENADEMVLTYTKASGSYNPSLSINALDPRYGGFRTVMQIVTSDEVTQSTLSFTNVATDRLVLSVSRSFLNFASGTQNSRFTIGLE